MSHAPPPIPADQRSPGPNAAAGQDAKTEGAKSNADVTEGLTDPRDEVTDLQSSQPGDDDVNLKQQGRQGDIAQNTTHQGYQQDR
jgi:hypothetical protein